LGQPISLRNAVQRWMMPRQQRRATRGARGRDRIVVLERDAVRAQTLLTRTVLPAVRRELIRLIRWWIPQLVGHHQQDVRAAILGRLAHWAAPFAATGWRTPSTIPSRTSSPVP